MFGALTNRFYFVVYWQASVTMNLEASIALFLEMG